MGSQTPRHNCTPKVKVIWIIFNFCRPDYRKRCKLSVTGIILNSCENSAVNIKFEEFKRAPGASVGK